MIHKFQPALLNSVSLTIFKSFVRPHLDRSDVINDQAYKEEFHLKLKSHE